MFILGMIVTHAVLGLLIAGLGGSGIQALLDRKWGVLLGPILILLGLIWAGWIRVPLPRIGLTAIRPDNSIGAFLLGVPFSVAFCPVCVTVVNAIHFHPIEPISFRVGFTGKF